MEEQSRKRFSFDSIVMYLITLVAEVPMIYARVIVLQAVVLIVALVKGAPTPSMVLWTQVALIPTYWSVSALVTPAGTGWWWQQRMGGREPSQREQLAYNDALELLQSHAQRTLPSPDGWFVLDTPQPDASVCGNTLMLSRGLLETDHLPAVLAHELGHLATPDGTLTAALNRLVLWEPHARHEQRAPWIIQKTLAAIRGGFGLWATRSLWGRYWRGCEYRADRYAASLGQADELADFLEIHALIHDHPVPFLWLTEHTHPATELRIDRLRSAAVATGPEPVKAAPSGPPTAGPDGPTLTEPDPSAGRALTSAGLALPRDSHRRTMESQCEP